MNKSIKLLVVFSFLMSSLFMYGIPIITFSGGEGTSDNPYQIATLADLRSLSENPGYWTNSKYFIQTADIDATETNTWNVGDHDGNAETATVPMGFSCIGTSTAGSFNGKYDGQGHVVSNLYINRPATNYVGLFGYINVSTATIRNLGLTNINVIGHERVGALVGWNNTGIITNTYSTGIVKGSTTVGGLVGMNNYGRISNSYSSATTEGNDGVGGLSGQTWAGSVVNSYAIGSVKGDVHVGGLMGYFGGSNAKIDKCYSAGVVTGNPGSTNVGGLVGTNYTGTPGVATSSYWDHQTSGQATSVVGISKTTAEMKTQATFSDWDFATIPDWKIDVNNSGYPYLAWQNFQLFSDGDGTLADPYQIKTAADMELIAAMVNSGSSDFTGIYFKLMNDISLSAYSNWSPIGNDLYEFRGVFNGNLKKITELTINSTSSYVGLFGNVGRGSVIKDLTIENCNVTSTGAVVGALAGRVRLDAPNQSITIDNCHSSGSVNGLSAVGGLIGMLTQYEPATGGDLYSVIVSNSSSSATVGLSSTYSGVAGGLIGDVSGGLSMMEMIPTLPQIKYCYATGNLSGTGQIYLGGLIGQVNWAIISNCYAMGNLSNDYVVGGFVGSISNSTVSNCYSTGHITGASNWIHGFIGSGYGDFSNCYWDVETSGKASDERAAPKTTAEMKTQATFSNWDFSSIPGWRIASDINNGYPYLTSQIDAPAVQASALVFSPVHNYDMTISWTNGNGVARAVFMKEETGAISLPVNKTTYTASSDWAVPGTQLQTSGYYCVYNGTGNSVIVSNLAKNTQYSVQVFEYNGGAGAEMYNTVAGADNPKSQTTANENETGLSADNTGKLIVYPNPVTDVFQIQGLSGVSSISITDLGGRSWLQKQVSEGENISVNDLPKGVYLLKIKNNESTLKHKLVKK